MKVRIKTKEELLADGWIENPYHLAKRGNFLITCTMYHLLGTIVGFKDADNDSIYVEGHRWPGEAIAEFLSDAHEFENSSSHHTCIPGNVGFTSHTIACKHCGRSMPELSKGGCNV